MNNEGLEKWNKIEVYRGFDVIKQCYFVKEHEVCSDGKIGIGHIKEFRDFDDYYNYLDGDIYVNACYYQCDFSGIDKEIDKSKLLKLDAFTEDSIDKYKPKLYSDIEELNYEEAEKDKRELKKWTKVFISCNSCEELKQIADAFTKSEYYIKTSKFYNRHYKWIDFFLWQYIFLDVHDIHRLNVIMRYISKVKGKASSGIKVRSLCHAWENPIEVLNTFDFSVYADSTRNRHIRELKKYIEGIEEDNIKITSTVYFDSRTHYYCEADSVGVIRYFETIDELLLYRNYDLRNADLTNDIKLICDYSKCVIDETTKLPKNNVDDYQHSVEKSYSNGYYYVHQKWLNSFGYCVDEDIHRFEWFFDFVKYLNGDLSKADLFFCDGLQYLKDLTKLDLTDAIISSFVKDKLGIEYRKYNIDEKKMVSFDIPEENENSTVYALKDNRDVKEPQVKPDLVQEFSKYNQRIYYVSDIHLLHILKHYRVNSKSDIEYVINFVVKKLVSEIAYYYIEESSTILLIGGDVSSDFSIFEAFVKELRNELDIQKKNYAQVIFVLGNHELWDFAEIEFDGIVHKYEKIINSYGMHLLQNSILYEESKNKLCLIPSYKLVESTIEDIREKLRSAKIIFFGGIAFSGYDESFNANNGIYRGAIDRKKEIEETNKFEYLYNKMIEAIPDRQLVVFTHTPMECWKKKVEYHNEYVYVSGHTHRNLFYDDGENRIYADNQIGYNNANPHLKYFEIDAEYDYFKDYGDGIYKITVDEYRQFYRGKNIRLNFNSNINILYMLKKRGYYCFIHESAGGSLTILNGGARKKLIESDLVEYYYNNMDLMISKIKVPLDKYTAVQEKIASEIRRIGGDGHIHGCIIDIDYYNHIYLNPIDMKVTGYWAESIVNKVVYPSIPLLLKEECPLLYVKYMQMLADNKDKVNIISKDEYNKLEILEQKYYLSTDIYRVSREVKKIQKLSSNILTAWYENDSVGMIE